MDYALWFLVLVSLGSWVFAYFLYRSYSNLIGMVEGFLYERNKEFKATLYSTGSFPRDVTNMTVEDVEEIKRMLDFQEER